LIAEVERSLGIFDAAVLVLSAVQGVQAQTVVLWRALRRLGVPIVVFVNKIDRAGAASTAVLDAKRERFDIPIDHRTRAHREGERTAYYSACPPARLPAGAARGRTGLLRIGDHRRRNRRPDRSPARAGHPRCRTAYRRRTGRQGVRRRPRRRHGRAWIRLWDGQIQLRQRLVVGDRSSPPVTRLAVAAPAGVVEARMATAGDIVAIPGGRLRIGDQIGAPRGRATPAFAPPVLQALVEPADPSARGALWTGLRELADEDPLIGLRLDDNAGQAAVGLHGEVQKEIIAAPLDQRYSVAARFTGTAVVCLERVRGVGEDVLRIGQQDNPYLATIGLRVTALPLGSGVVFDPGIERGTLPPAFIAATEGGSDPLCGKDFKGGMSMTSG